MVGIARILAIHIGINCYCYFCVRYFIDHTIELTGSKGQDFWRQRAKQLPEDPEMLVTGEEVASALLTWLEELVGEGPEDSEDSEEEPEKEVRKMC